jgi:hypothetical protein
VLVKKIFFLIFLRDWKNSIKPIPSFCICYIAQNNFFGHTLLTYLLKITANTMDNLSSTVSVLTLELPGPN